MDFPATGLVVLFSMDALKDLKGSDDVTFWFGEWPSFHDAEIQCLNISTTGESFLQIRTWKMTSKVSANGNYILEKECTITFELKGILDLNLTGFSSQNVIDGLTIEKADGGIKLTLNQCFGLAGEISAKEISVKLKSIAK